VAKTDKIDAWVLAELARRTLVPAIWLPHQEMRADRERARFRLHLVRHRTALKNRIHAQTGCRISGWTWAARPHNRSRTSVRQETPGGAREATIA
jgi:hypothetical protein